MMRKCQISAIFKQKHLKTREFVHENFKSCDMSSYSVTTGSYVFFISVRGVNIVSRVTNGTVCKPVQPEKPGLAGA